MSLSSFLPAAVLILATLSLAPSEGLAQRSTTTASSTPLLIQGRGSAVPVRAERSPPVPGALSADAQLALARAALGTRANVSGIGSKLRVTPAQPFAANQAELRTGMALDVRPESGGGVITLQTDVTGTPGGPKVEVSFRSGQANRPVLVDFILTVSEVNAPVRVWVGGQGVSEQRILPAGDHHVTTIVMPGDTGWYTVFFLADKSPVYQRIWVHAVELTTLN